MSIRKLNKELLERVAYTWPLQEAFENISVSSGGSLKLYSSKALLQIYDYYKILYFPRYHESKVYS